MSTQSDPDPGATAKIPLPTPPPPLTEEEGPGAWVRLLGWAVQQFVVVPWIGVLVFIIIIGAFLSLTTSSFLNQGNLFTVAQEFSYIEIAALGGAMVIMTRGIDLSVGSNMALTGLVTAEVSVGHPAWEALLAGLAVGLLVGLVNAFLITVIGLQPFIATLGMLSVVRGAGTVRSQGFTLYPSSAFTTFGQGGNGPFAIGPLSVGPIPNPVIVMVVLTIIFAVLLSNTALGRHIYAVGGNETAARLLGIRTNRVKVVVYALAGLLGGVAGILLMSFLGSASPANATGYELLVIASAVIGGVSLFGGEGSLVGVLLGAALIAQIQNGEVLENVPGYWNDLVVGFVILLALAIDQGRRWLRRRLRLA